MFLSKADVDFFYIHYNHMHIYYLLNITKGTQSSMILFDPVTFKKNVKKKTQNEKRIFRVYGLAWTYNKVKFIILSNLIFSNVKKEINKKYLYSYF